jgi:hypothetical protein
MASESYAAQPSARSLPRAELVLGLLALASFALIPVRITTIYSGLPAHPLFLHVPVVLIPVAAIGALLIAVWPNWITRFGVPLAALTVVALAGTFLTVGAGIALRDALHLNGAGGGFGFGPGTEIARHAHAADILRLLMIGFTAVMIITVLAHRIAAGAPTGLRAVDRGLARPVIRGVLRVLLGALAIACAYFVFHTGDLGAKAVWAGRLSGGGQGGGPAGLFGPSPGGPGGASGAGNR